MCVSVYTVYVCVCVCALLDTGARVVWMLRLLRVLTHSACVLPHQAGSGEDKAQAANVGDPAAFLLQRVPPFLSSFYWPHYYSVL